MSQSIGDILSLPVILAWLRLNLRKVFLGGIVCALVWLPVAILKPRTYESTATILVSPPTFKDRSKTLLTKDPTVQADSTIAEMMPRALPVESYKAIALSSPLLAEVIQRAQLGKTASATLKRALDVELVQMGGRGAPAGSMYTQTLMFHTSANSPELAAKIAQTWAETFKEQVDSVAKKGVSETFKLLDTLHKDTKSELEKADFKLAEDRKACNLELIKAQLEAKQKEYTDFDDALKQAEVDLASREMELKTLDEEILKEPQKLVYFRAPSDDAYWITADQNGVKSRIQPDQGLRTEESNVNYEEIRTLAVAAKQERDGLKAKREAIVMKLDELRKELQALTDTFSDRTVERDKLMRESESLKASYKTVRAEYEKGQMADRTQASDIVILGNAIASNVPTNAGATMNIIMAGFLGMVAVGAFLLLKEVSEMVPLLGAGRLDASRSQVCGADLTKPECRSSGEQADSEAQT